MARSQDDADLGMDRPISRRDFLGGVGIAVAAGLVPGRALGQAGVPGAPPGMSGPHPPGLVGLRGNHAGSFEIAHQLALEGRHDFGPVAEDPDVEYDLVVVGAGISGLAAAHFFRRAQPGARILLLDNHDDFGGHAKRNEFRFGEQILIGYGGSQSLEAPSDYSEVAKGLLVDLGVETQRFYDYYDQGFFRRNGLGFGIYFDRASYGVDRVVRGDWLGGLGAFFEIDEDSLPPAEALSQMPISETARRQLVALVANREDRLPDQSIFAEPGYLRTLSYEAFLRDHLGVTDPQALGLLRNLLSGYFGFGNDAIPALDALLLGLPGLDSTSLGTLRRLVEPVLRYFVEPYIFHFPDGNASIARLLVRSLVPDVAEGETMEDVVTAHFDYTKLDQPDSPVRLRLNSTVVGVANVGAPAASRQVTVDYVRAGRAHRVRARSCVLACYNMAIPFLCPELPRPQRESLRELVKVPLVYTNVLLRSRESFQRIGIGVAHCPGSYHETAMIDFPVSMGSYRFSPTPKDPVIVHLSRVPTDPGKPPRDQHRKGRQELLATSFESIERATRTQLAGMLAAGGFDPARDIRGITVNRWPHGYAYDYSSLFDPDYADDAYPHVLGRKRFGRIAIANSDAGGRAYLDCAIDEAHRAVTELA